MGQAASTNAPNSGEKVELRTDLPKSKNPFVNTVYGYFVKHQTDGTALPADFVAAIGKLSAVRVCSDVSRRFATRR